MERDAIIVGAGPAGAAAAWHLARSGRNVLLLDRQSFPRDKSCGDGLTRSAVALLQEMGVLGQLGDAYRVRGARFRMRGRGTRIFEYPEQPDGIGFGLVLPRLQLDHILCQSAVAQGAELWEKALAERLVMEGGRVTGVEVVHRGERKQIHARVVIAADGAASRLALQAGLVATAAKDAGSAIRCYFEQLTGLENLLEIYTPLLDATDRYLLPSYGWVFPTSDTTANVGVGLFEREPGANLRELFDRFIENLRRDDPRFASAVVTGPPKGAPLRFDFAPERCGIDGLFLAGDAGGMISPFTGEGISYALESGKIAAQVIAGTPGRNGKKPDHTEYARLLAQRHAGYFETGRHAARRYLFVWHVLDSTFHNDRPLYALCRQGALFPDTVSDRTPYALLDDVSSCIPRDSFRLRADLYSIGQILNDTVRQDWPFLARLAASHTDRGGIPFRPALLLLLSAYLGDPQSLQLNLAGAAIELGYLAALAQISVTENPAENSAQQQERPVNWGNLFAITVADFLLSRAYQLGSQAGTGVSNMIAESLGQCCEARVRELRNAFNLSLTLDEHLEIMANKAGTLFELPCRLGACLGTVPVDALAVYGRQLGIAHQLTEDSLELEGRPRSFGIASTTDLSDGIYSTPLRLVLSQPGENSEQLKKLLSGVELSPETVGRIRSLVKESGAAAVVMRLATEASQRARKALDPLPPAPGVDALRRLAGYAVARNRPAG